jgi:hypothetical protein
MRNLKALVKRSAPWLVMAYRRVRYRELATRAPADTFTDIYARNAWGDAESVSGPGSSKQQTSAVRDQLPCIMRELGVQVLLDVPCGDFAWMRHIDLGGVTYIGGDIVEPLIQENQRLYGRPGRSFMHLDLTANELPPADLVLVRDCFVHLPLAMIEKALSNLRRSGATYLLTTTFIDCAENEDILPGLWRPLNLRQSPFNLPEPLRLVDERNSAHPGKHLGLWRLADIQSH